MQTLTVDQLIIKENKLYLQDAFGITSYLPNLTSLYTLYHQTDDEVIKNNIAPILREELGILLIVEIMIDATHEVTINRLKTGEISKNMKHVHDYYMIPKSHFALAQKQYLEEKAQHSIADAHFADCHFAMFPFGLAIMKSAFPNYTNLYTSTNCLLDQL